VVGLTLAAVLLHESLAPMQWVGVAIIVASCTAVPLVARRQPTAPSTPPLVSGAGVGEAAVFEPPPRDTQESPTHPVPTLDTAGSAVLCDEPDGQSRR
ncbi:MAG: DMT family transporter, partial [Mycobacterium sp.]